ncbi:MAG: hypothetical protein JSU00_12565 [Acidobacteria bacterium]|nr:hypothetical protein [Acidobacteriota bacterium]
METELVEATLTRVASVLECHLAGTSFDDAVTGLRRCESELVTRRFKRTTAADGRSIRVRVPAADAALIHVSRALSLIGDESHLDEAREVVAQAREEVAHMA